MSTEIRYLNFLSHGVSVLIFLYGTTLSGQSTEPVTVFGTITERESGERVVRVTL